MERNKNYIATARPNNDLGGYLKELKGGIKR